MSCDDVDLGLIGVQRQITTLPTLAFEGEVCTGRAGREIALLCLCGESPVVQVESEVDHPPTRTADGIETLQGRVRAAEEADVPAPTVVDRRDEGRRRSMHIDVVPEIAARADEVDDRSTSAVEWRFGEGFVNDDDTTHVTTWFGHR
jgi:hypothetical protein